MPEKSRLSRSVFWLFFLFFSLISLALQPLESAAPQTLLTPTPEELSLGQDFIAVPAAASSDGMVFWAFVVFISILLPLGWHLRQALREDKAGE